MVGSIRVTTTKSLHSNLAIANIIRLEGVSNYTRIFTIDGKEHMSAYNIGKFARQLPEIFFRIHKSHLISLAFVKLVEVVNRQVILTLDDDEQTRLTVSRQRRDKFLTTYNQPA